MLPMTYWWGPTLVLGRTGAYEYMYLMSIYHHIMHVLTCMSLYIMSTYCAYEPKELSLCIFPAVCLDVTDSLMLAALDQEADNLVIIICLICNYV